MKLLSIGNSFSQDAQRYLSKIATSDGEELYTTNLFIGGCTLERHYNCMIDRSKSYEIQINGECTGNFTDLESALIGNDWDVITLQQLSTLSGRYESFFPFVTELLKFIRNKCPNAKVYLQRSWAYEDGSEILKNGGYNSTAEMYEKMVETCDRIYKEVGFDGIINTGDAMFSAYKKGLKIYRDGFHASLGIGRFLIALAWYKTIYRKSVSGIGFKDFDVPVTEEERIEIIKIVEDIIKI